MASRFKRGKGNTYSPPPPPTISGISPSSGTTLGGTSVVITGTYLTGASAVAFGGVAAASFVVNSSTQITATTPANGAGAYAVTATTPNGTATSGANMYTFVVGVITVPPKLTAGTGTFTLTGIAATLTAPSSGFNGSKLQTNLNAMQSAGDFPWLNALKAAQRWDFGNFANAPVTPDLLDSNGYLKSSAGNASTGVQTVTNIPSQSERSGNWVIKWDGDGTCAIDGTALAYTISSITQSGGIQTVTLSASPVEMKASQPISITGVSGSVNWGSFSTTWQVLDVNTGTNSFRVNTGTTYTGTQTLSTPKATFITSSTVSTGLTGAGRYATTPSVNARSELNYGIYIQSIASSVNYPQNVRVFHINDEAALDAGGEFTQRFLDTCAHYGVIRFLNWNAGNVTNCTTWNTRKTQGYVFYAADEIRNEFYGGATTLAGSTYSVSAPSINSSTGAAWAGLTDKATVHLLFAQTTTSGSILLNVGGTGAKPLLTNFGSALVGSFYPISGTYQSLGTVVYDITLDAWLKNGGDTVGGFGSAGIKNSAPIESMLSLCSQVGAHPWWPMPHLALDPMTDYFPSLVKYVKDNKPAWMIPRYEGCNELWNFNQPGVNYATAKATVYGWGADYHNWYGKILSTMGQAAAYINGIGNLGTSYQLIGGVQGAFYVTGDMASSAPRFASTKYIADNIVQSPMTGSWGTITFASTPPVAAAGGATNYVSHITPANYYASNARSLSYGTQTDTTLASAWSGVRFIADTVTSGVMLVSSVSVGTIATGMTIFGPYGGPTVTVSSITGTLPTLSVTTSDATWNVTYSQVYTGGADLTAPVKFADSVVDTVVNATITGANFVVNSMTSGNTIGQTGDGFGIQVYGGTIAWASGVRIASMTDSTHFTLTSSPGNQTASFSIGKPYSLTGVAFYFLNWATWANSNFAIKKICGYEGGYSNDYGAGSSIDILTYQSKQAANMNGYTVTDFDNVRGIGTITYPATVSGEFPSVFNMTGPYPSADAWSVLEDIYQSPDSPQWAAIKVY